MTAPATRLVAARGHGRAEALTAAWLLSGLAVAVGVRWLATARGGEPLLVGLAFGLGLAAVWLVAAGGPAAAAAQARAAPRQRRRLVGGLVAGGVAGIALAGLVPLGAGIAGSQLVPGLSRPAAPFVPWAAVIVLVAVAEEAILRGALFDRTHALAGTGAAIALTTVAFALLHVPLYGWHVVPLDLAVGLVLGGLRLSTGTVLAPATAHAVADLATWWM